MKDSASLLLFPPGASHVSQMEIHHNKTSPRKQTDSELISSHATPFLVLLWANGSLVNLQICQTHPISYAAHTGFMIHMTLGSTVTLDEPT